MMILIFISLTSFIVTLILMTLSLTVSKKTNKMREKLIPFECGFNFFNFARMPFSMQFFLIAIIFIIFDVEIILILPLIPSIFKSNLIKWSLTSTSFLMILILGIFIEWKEKSFEWKK
ncbi:NADH dehydrogenase subunit 3 (mitochondrion) [Thrips palmi]|uniref:NADH-ubiquinone oxidoreductase chain 3 n=1 Tax=Thrips palmi TaxID=161013 RepID=A0A386T8Z6_THRPL|nr:NADH dehydrogenase subunit 3 [Thrips palmi]AYE84563.1 NADH dehydrogenase subunit 3 [Thrips palmi]UKT59940.1 NADH dehydrogenase subunit 3 [Thrips palmi]